MAAAVSQAVLQRRVPVAILRKEENDGGVGYLDRQEKKIVGDV